MNSIPKETILNKIYFIRGQKVMLDSDIAELYQVETKRLKEQVKRNINRFPKNNMFELTQTDRIQNINSNYISLPLLN